MFSQLLAQYLTNPKAKTRNIYYFFNCKDAEQDSIYIKLENEKGVMYKEEKQELILKLPEIREASQEITDYLKSLKPVSTSD